MAPTDGRSGQPQRKKRRWLSSQLHDGLIQRGTAAVWMTILIALPVLVAYLTLWRQPDNPTAPADVSVAALKVFTVWCLAFLPGWLYVRFLGQRAGALWNEFVLNLHRLGLDQPQFLPRPPVASEYYDRWVQGGGPAMPAEGNLYRQKFIAYYGRSVPVLAGGHHEGSSRSEDSDATEETALRRTNFAVRTETMFPVFITTAALAVIWVALLWDTDFLVTPSSVWDVLKYALLGSYAFIVQSLIRRFFQSDLRPSAYTSAMLRIVFSLIVSATVTTMLRDSVSYRTLSVLAFVIGFFPVVGLQALQRAAAAVLKVAVPQLAPAYPLNQLDGLNIWYETRLVEEGIEDMENLATANIVDVMLHTRVPVGRLVDWMDQAHLYLHLDRTEHGFLENRRARRGATATSEGGSAAGNPAAHSYRPGTRTRVALRQLGIRNATDLLKAFPPDLVDAEHGGGTVRGDGHSRNGAGGVAARREQMREALAAAHLDPDQVATLVRVLDEDTGLAPLWNWQEQGIAVRNPLRRPRSARPITLPGAPPSQRTAGSGHRAR